MERELWPRLYHLVMEVGQTLRLTDVTYQPHIIVLVFLWAALHDRPVSWACDERNWATTTLRPATLPDPSTLSRRLRRVDTAMLMRALVQRVRQEGDPTRRCDRCQAAPGRRGQPGPRCPLRPRGRDVGQRLQIVRDLGRPAGARDVPRVSHEHQ